MASGGIGRGRIGRSSLAPSGQHAVGEYLRSLSVAQRRLAGQVYTPLLLADFILEQAGYHAGRAIETQTLLDPACGAGVFLVAAIRRLMERLRGIGFDLSSSTGQALALRRIVRNFYAVDIDPIACELTRAAVRAEVAAVVGVPVSPSFFRKNVVCSDYLLGCGTSKLSRRLRLGVDFVVGNPPYVSTTRIAAAYKARLRRRFRTASGRFDLYTLFMERSLSILNRGGRMALITPNKFLISVTSRPLRELFVREGAIRTIVNFRSHKVFENAATVPCITVFERGASGTVTTLLECRDPQPSGKLQILTRSELNLSDGRDGPWHLSSNDYRSLADAIRRDHPVLQDCSARVSAGLATGCDAIYVLPESEARGVETEILRPALRGRDLAPYEITDPGLQVIVPYTFDSSGRPHLVDLAAYPRAHAYLASHRALLKRRHCHRVWDKAWYDIHDPVPFDLAAQPKILVPDVARTNRFVFDPGRYCPLHSAYYLVPKGVDPLYLTSVLNSAPLEFLIRLLAPVIKDGFSRYRRQFLLGLPIPRASVEKVCEIVDAVRERDYKRAEWVVSTLFGLSEAQQDAISRFLGSLARGKGHTAVVG